VTGDDFQTLLAENAFDRGEPPIGDLVELALIKGRRMRMARRFKAGAVALAVMAVAGVSAGTIILNAGAGTRVAVVTAAAPSAAAPSPAETSAVRTGKQVKATPAGLMELLTKTLPAGKTSNYAGVADNGGGMPFLQIYLDRGRGPGMIRMGVLDRVTLGGRVTNLPGGISYSSGGIADNCIQHTMVTVRHADGSGVWFNLSNCLAWDGKQNKPSVQALTVEEAVEVGSDPRWGTTIDQALNAEGAKDFPHLPTEFGR
jgi:hypothetical protein